jgi:hypothetical protein
LGWIGGPPIKYLCGWRSPGIVNAVAPGHTETDLARCKFERQSLCQCFDGAFRGSVQQLKKVHSQGWRSLPAKDGSWRELDSSLSSDALLMNIFCYPGVTRRREVCRILGLEPGSVPDFGFMPRVLLLSEATERTEVDMKLGNMIFEAKLTEGDFQIQRTELVEGYRDLRDIFECRRREVRNCPC